MRTMKALVKEKSEPGLWLKEVPVPDVGDNDVRIKIRKTAICGTDAHIYQWNCWARQTIPAGVVIGHEFVGEIDAVGRNVNGY